MIALLLAGFVAFSGLLLMFFSPGTLPAWLTSNLAVFSQAAIFVWAVLYFVFWVPYLDHRKLTREIRRLNTDLDRLKTPNLSVSSDESKDDNSVSRDWGVRYWLTPTSDPVVWPTDFFGFVITNHGTDTIINCRACITQIDRLGHGPVWRKHIALNFEPKSSTEKEPIESVTLPHDLPIAVCLCSVMAQSHFTMVPKVGTGSCDPRQNN